MTTPLGHEVMMQRLVGHSFSSAKFPLQWESIMYHTKRLTVQYKVKRGLTLWKEGYNSYALKDTTAKNSEYSFKDDPWRTITQKYYMKISALGEAKWKEIIQEVMNYLPKGWKNKTVAADGGAQRSGNGVADSDDDIEMSD
ncbi:uncharacterized protein EV420DRAFT_1486560 [Desarmillaria tabescens]|uniref:Uncharacterized protein n=1 Tax=Armillaria tabescens TaxID=1929756 RepID=A0AA39JCK5_ARMTA|nr:uncharacterized protein EV420DRAFT_1486560 [Desarmillaria tabescens]KAK0438849.1 hypothetical protein EV420DRAFT_1486560 [Desarmillaria tabescens]